MSLGDRTVEVSVIAKCYIYELLFIFAENLYDNHVCLFILKALNCYHDNEFWMVRYGFPPFHNLTELELNVEVYCEETLLHDFLTNSQNLQSLVFPQVS